MNKIISKDSTKTITQEDVINTIEIVSKTAIALVPLICAAFKSLNDLSEFVRNFNK